MNNKVRTLFSITLVLLLSASFVKPAMAQDNTGSNVSEFFDDNGNLLPGVTDMGEIEVEASWMSQTGANGVATNNPTYRQYVNADGDTALVPSASTLISMIFSPEESGLLSVDDAYQTGAGNLLSQAMIGQLTAYFAQGDPTGDLTQTAAQKLYDKFYGEGGIVSSDDPSASYKQQMFWNLLNVSFSDKQFSTSYLVYSAGNCANSPVGCQATCQANPAACAAASSLIPTPVPYTAPSCPASTIVPGSPSLSITKTGPSNPLVVGQDPDRRGADVSFSVVVPPTVYTYYIPIPIYEDVQICMANEDGSAVVGGNCKAGSSTTNNGKTYNVKQLVRVDCEKHVEVYAEPIGAVNASADLNSESINWINNELSSYYYGAHTIQTSFGLVPGLGSANVYCDGGKTCYANGAVTNIPFADPGTFSLNLFAATSGTPVTTGRTFRTSGSLQVSFISVRLIENGSR